MAERHPESHRKETVVPFRKAPVGRQGDAEADARWQTLLAAVADIHTIIMQGVLSGCVALTAVG